MVERRELDGPSNIGPSGTPLVGILPLKLLSGSVKQFVGERNAVWTSPAGILRACSRNAQDEYGRQSHNDNPEMAGSHDPLPNVNSTELF
jgi:hypothetical protein